MVDACALRDDNSLERIRAGYDIGYLGKQMVAGNERRSFRIAEDAFQFPGLDLGIDNGEDAANLEHPEDGNHGFQGVLQVDYRAVLALKTVIEEAAAESIGGPIDLQIGIAAGAADERGLAGTVRRALFKKLLNQHVFALSWPLSTP